MHDMSTPPPLSLRTGRSSEPVSNLHGNRDVEPFFGEAGPRTHGNDHLREKPNAGQDERAAFARVLDNATKEVETPFTVQCWPLQ